MFAIVFITRNERLDTSNAPTQNQRPSSDAPQDEVFYA